MNAGIFVPAMLTKARIFMARREQEAAFALVQETRIQALRNEALSFITVIDAFEAKLFVQAGQPQFTTSWVENCRLQADGWIDPSREFEQITWLRFLSASEKAEQALCYAERLAQVYELKNRKAAVAEIKMIQALLLWRQKNETAAVKKIDQALKLGFSEGYIRLFADEGVKLYRLLTMWGRQKNIISKRANDPLFRNYIDTLFDAYQNEDCPTSLVYPLSSLTKQEMIILKLLSNGLANKEISETLGTSTETVKRHCKNIYKKLSVSGRHEAVSMLNDHILS